MSNGTDNNRDETTGKNIISSLVSRRTPSRLWSMTAKEFGQLLRDKPILILLFWAFTAIIYAAGHSASMEVSNYPVAVYDLSQSPHSRSLIDRLQKPYFKIVRYAETEDRITADLDSGRVSLALIIPADFEQALTENRASVQVISDGTLSMPATIAGAHISSIVYDYALSLLAERNMILPDPPQIDGRIRVEYNQNLVNSWFASMLEMLNMITMISALLTASAMVREKEYGTLERLMVSPLRPAELFAAKIIPTVVLIPAFSALAIFGVIQGVFDTPLRGSLLLFFSVSAIYVFAMASLGLAIAMMARNVSQAMMILLLILFPMIFLSGAFTPPESMAPWMRYGTLLSPMRYYMDFGYQVLFKGSELTDIWPDILGIIAWGAVMFTFAVKMFRRTIR